MGVHVFACFRESHHYISHYTILCGRGNHQWDGHARWILAAGITQVPGKTAINLHCTIIALIKC